MTFRAPPCMTELIVTYHVFAKTPNKQNSGSKER